MAILAYLPSRLLRQLEFVLGKDQSLLTARNRAEINLLLQTQAISLAIIDPVEGPDNALRLEQLMTEYPSLPVIAYVSLTPQAFTTIAQASQRGLRHVVLYSHDDGAQRFRSLIDEVQFNSLSLCVRDRLRLRLAMLPPRLGNAFESLFAEPHRFPNAQEFAIFSGIPLVSVYRAFHEAGLATPKRVLIAAKLLKGYAYLCDTAYSVTAVSKKLGYRQTRIFVDHSVAIFSVNPSRLHTCMTRDQAVERVLSFVELTADERRLRFEFQPVSQRIQP